MLNFEKILLPVDFSDRCAMAASHVIPMARRFRSELVLLHVLPAESAEQRLNARRLIDDFLHAETRDLKVARILAVGEPASQIVQQAQAAGCGLIALATHGAGHYRRLLLGSVAAAVLHDANCPVWTIAHTDAGAAAWPYGDGRLLCAADLGPHGARTLECACRLADRLECELALVHALDCPTRWMPPGFREQAIEGVKAELAKQLQSAGRCAESVVEFGGAEEVVCQVAQRLNASMLVIGRGSAAGVIGRLKATAYGIIRGAPCPVISL